MGLRLILLAGIILFIISSGACKKNIDNNENVYIAIIEEDDNEIGEYLDEIKGDEDETDTLCMLGEEMEEHMSDIEVLKENIDSYNAGTCLGTFDNTDTKLERLFYINSISEDVKKRINGKSYSENCEITYEDLRYLRVLHIGFDGKTYIGELIVNRVIAEVVIDIFTELYQVSYPIDSILLVDEYGADDIISMEANNSSAFNYRFIEGTDRISCHGYGLAIDINPLYNPYITMIDGVERVFPEGAIEHVDREKDCEYYITKGDICYEAFTSRGFTWGGDWRKSKDYQHFETDISRR